MSAGKPWLKFYPRDWRGDQALRHVSLPARGLWIDMICIMYEATPYGHLTIGGQPVSEVALAKHAGTSVEEVQALLVELLAAEVCRRTRTGVLYSKRMLADHKRSVEGKKAKTLALAQAAENNHEKSPPSRVPTRPPYTQKPEARAKVEGPKAPSTLSDAKNDFIGPDEVRIAFLSAKGEEWVRSYIDRCGWQDLPCRALLAANSIALSEINQALRALARDKNPVTTGLTVIPKERAA
ncbi:hypothetical protein [Caulobacter sp. AP07]|uniref:hypothetical protein n=1 Tax=Caulobacter sp. AP07 TaxID=1144304 RepID=UPI0012F70E6B|nr:hypothetical protein [Caulobacter sp. AP07]